jgi:hypothetical protein
MSADTAFVAKGKGLQKQGSQKQGSQKSGTLAMSAASPPTAAIEAEGDPSKVAIADFGRR